VIAQGALQLGELICRESVLHALSRHIGREHGITARALVMEICGEHSAGRERVLRKTVELLRKDGHAIVALPSDGYFIARDRTELDDAIAFLRARALTSLVQIRQLKRLAAPELHGQRRLRT
jgi:hypothetical protein